MSEQYYYLISSLPELNTRGGLGEHQLESLQETIEDNLSDADRALFQYLVFRNDNKNLLFILRQREGVRETPRLSFHRPCAFSHQRLEEGLAGLGSLPRYMHRFLEERRSGRLSGAGRRLENRLTELYYDEALQAPNSFIRSYFYFKRDLKNIVSALNARRVGYPLEEVLLGQYELSERLLDHPGADFGLGLSHPYVAELAELIDERRFKELEVAIDRIQLEYLDELTAFDYFGAAQVFAYFIKLSLSHRWLDLKRDAGLQELNVIIENVLRTASLPEEKAFAANGAGSRSA